MKILLLGDYSNVHATLAQGLREQGHHVVLASDGDGWKDYPRDVDLRRPSLRPLDTLLYWGKLWHRFLDFRHFDVVQLINPVFLPLRAERHWSYYRFLRRHNRSLFLGAFGMDHYWVKTGLDCTTFRYSDFNIGAEFRQREDNNIWIRDWLNGEKGRLNRFLAHDADGIVAGLYEYHASYVKEFARKLVFIPFPIDVDNAPLISDFGKTSFSPERKVRFFVGIQRHRHSYKGTDRLLHVLRTLRAEMPDQMDIVEVENLPFSAYKQAMLSCDVLVDQLYSYTPAMNALQAMAQGLVVVSGGEPEHYELLGCRDLRPIVNVLPDEKHIYQTLRQLIKNKHQLPRLSRESRAYVERYHNHRHVTNLYIAFWQRYNNRENE